MVLLRSLVYLQEVAKTQSINKAAENLYISKSALSTAIKNLEQEFGVPLLNRSVQGVTLTDAGEMVVERSTLIFNILNGMKEECKLYTDAHHEINFFMEDRFANSIFPHILTELKQLRPNTYITVQTVLFEEITSKVMENPNNVGIFLSSGWDGQPPENVAQDVVFRHIDSYEICVATAKYSKYVPLNVTELTYEEIQSIPSIELMLDARSYKSWPESGMRPEQNYVMSTDNNNVYFQAILNDFGIGMMLKVAVPFGLADRSKLRFIPIKDADVADLWLVYNKNNDETYMEQLRVMIKAAMDMQR
ncbi:MAG: LysR family transcriptional regulator [Peptococcaceae bacterium]|nr:LysR family transcriptional regulator [Peptococcaceae bacterium]